jgi:hypothetical protein
MINLAKDIWWLMGICVTIVGFLVGLGYNLRSQKLRIQIIERNLKTVCQDSGQLTIAMLAVLNGLGQLKCDGDVTKAHVTLKNYLASSRIQEIDLKD